MERERGAETGRAPVRRVAQLPGAHLVTRAGS
jgi:hypothetical protein